MIKIIVDVKHDKEKIVHLNVKDTGRGIDPSIFYHLF
jgi:hypothetical protein